MDLLPVSTKWGDAPTAAACLVQSVAHYQFLFFLIHTVLQKCAAQQCISTSQRKKMNPNQSDTLIKNIVAQGSVICGRISSSPYLSSKHQLEYHKCLEFWPVSCVEIILFSPSICWKVQILWETDTMGSDRFM